MNAIATVEKINAAKAKMLELNPEAYENIRAELMAKAAQLGKITKEQKALFLTTMYLHLSKDPDTAMGALTALAAIGDL
jgi:hypothetical protein